MQQPAAYGSSPRGTATPSTLCPFLPLLGHVPGLQLAPVSGARNPSTGQHPVVCRSWCPGAVLSETRVPPAAHQGEVSLLLQKQLRSLSRGILPLHFSVWSALARVRSPCASCACLGLWCSLGELALNRAPHGGSSLKPLCVDWPPCLSPTPSSNPLHSGHSLALSLCLIIGFVPT